MVDRKLVCAAIVAWGAIACTAPTTTPKKTPNPLVVSSNCHSLEKVKISDEIIIEQNTVGTISNHAVGVSNIFERELPDDKGVIALRMSANLSIWDIASQQTRHEKVFAGKVITLGTDRYCVVHVKYGESSSGSVTLRKIP
jgi:hypothetical protein